ncbi:MAG: hypothetical protein ACKVX9_21845, partial [Blastocatellia bacterium]
LRFTAGYRLVFLRNTTMRRLSINIAKLCPTFNHTREWAAGVLQPPIPMKRRWDACAIWSD